MKSIETYYSANQLAARWACCRTSVLRICKRYGYSGHKMGARNALRRYAASEIERIERAANGRRK